MKKIFIFLLFSTIYQFSFSQNKISGKVIDKLTQEPLIGATIYLTDLKKGTITNLEGKFTFENIKNGNYLLEVSYVGYQTFIQNLLLQKDTVLTISIAEAHKELSEVVVTGVTRSTELKHSPIIIKSLDKNLMNQNSSTNLIDALKNIPGVNQITTGVAISKPIIRGLGYNRIITLNNGIRQEGQQWGDEHGIEIDEYNIDKVEIIKGPGSLLYGSDAIAGVLNFLPPRMPINDEIKSQFLINYQTNNQLVGYSLSNVGNKKGFQWNGRLSNKIASNYQNKYDDKVYNSGFKEYDGSLTLGINKNWGHAQFTISSYNSSINLVEGERDSMGNFLYINQNGGEVVANAEDLKGYKIGFPHQEISHFRIASNNYWVLNKGIFQTDIAYQNNTRKEFGDPTMPKDIALFFDLKTINYNFRYNLEKVKGWESSVGISGMYQSNLNKGLEFLIPEYKLFDVGAFIFTQKSIKNLTIAGGLRWDNRWLNAQSLFLDSIGVPINNPNATQKFDYLNKNFKGFSGSVGLTYQINSNSTLKFNLSRGFRAPSVAELTSNGRHEGSFRYEIGNSNLKPELSHQVDIAYFYNSDHLLIEFTPFVNFISNYIFSEKLLTTNGLDSISDPNDPVPSYKFTKGNATLYGSEIYVDFHPHPFDWLHLEHSFSLVRAIQSNQSDSTKYLPYIPAPKYRGEIKAAFNKLNNTFSEAYIKFGVEYFFKQSQYFKAYQTETATPDYLLLHASLGFNIRAFKRKDAINLNFIADNIGNVAYQSHLSRLKYAPTNPLNGRTGVYNMGRNFSLKMIINF